MRPATAAAATPSARAAAPDPASPPFRELHHRYRPGELDKLLAEGMLAPTDRPEEGEAPRHPRMPQAALGEDEVAALKAYLHSLEPKPGR